MYFGGASAFALIEIVAYTGSYEVEISALSLKVSFHTASAAR